ncbi:MAG: 3-keto-disaccharide hydrolase [Planctomycetaceae bacterium]
MRILLVTAVAMIAIGLPVRAGNERPTAGSGWIELFNGKDLEGWEPLVSVPTPGLFTVVVEDGAPVIRISGEMVAGLATRREFENYHLELEFKWGPGRFGPRAQVPSDSGLLYHGCDNHNPGSGWLESVEFGILEGGETGDFWSVPGQYGQRVTVDVEAESIPVEKRRYDNEPLKYRAGGKKYTVTQDGILISEDNEKPHGQWNKIELYCLGQTSVHVVNGTVNMVLTGIRRQIDGKEVPLTRGRLQLQSEWAEVYYRNLRLKPITELPAAIRQALNQPPPNTLTPEEQAQGWRLLFDGQSPRGWRGYRQQTPPAAWRARDGALVCAGHAGDLITADLFDNFELLVDWKVARGGNSGIFYRATEKSAGLYQSSPEYEIRDNAFWLDDPYTSAACYALYAPEKDATHPVGYWNRARIVARKNHVEHWLNGQRVVSYDLDSANWKERVAASKFDPQFEFGQAARGHIGLQDHGSDQVWFRNIKLRPLSELP